MRSPDLTPPVTALHKLLNSDHGELAFLEGDCEALMQEIETTAKEVGGDPMNSNRYVVAREIREKIADLRKILNGTYQYYIASAERKG